MSVDWFRKQVAAGNVNKKGSRIVVGASPAVVENQSSGGKRHKYGAIEEVDKETGKKAKSRLQQRHESEYRKMLRDGEIACYASEVEISLKSPRTGGNHTYKCDHLLIHWDGRQEYIDSKGFETKEYIKKANWMERQFLPRNPLATFKARRADGIHVYQAKPSKEKPAGKESKRASKE